MLIGLYGRAPFVGACLGLSCISVREGNWSIERGDGCYMVVKIGSLRCDLVILIKVGGFWDSERGAFYVLTRSLW